MWITPNNSNSTTMCKLDSFSLHSNSERSPDTSTANALSRSEDQWSSPFLYSLKYLCAIDHLCAFQRWQTSAGPQCNLSLENTKCSRCIHKQVLGNILTTLVLAQNKSTEGKDWEKKKKEEVGKSHRNFSSKMKPTAGTSFKFGLV